MSPLFRGLTLALLLLPVWLGIFGLIFQMEALILVSLLMLLLYPGVWLWCRPAAFIISSSHLKIKFPAWCRTIPLRDLSNIRLIDRETFHQECGWALRIGVGGLWGGFGWLWTSRKGFLEFYISRTDQFVFIERLTGNPLLLTPSNHQEMIELLESRLRARHFE